MRAFSFHQRVSVDSGLAHTGLLITGGVVVVAIFWVGVRTAYGQQERPGPGDAVSMDADGVDPSNIVCGPRCVQYLLKHYGQEVDLIELVREMQWPELEAGTTMDTIEKALNSRGIHTLGMQLAPRARLKWPHPVLVHMKVEGAKFGHFAVRLPSSSDTVDLWCGLAGIQRVSEDELSKRCTGAVLLTAPKPITDVESAIERAGVPAYVWWICFSGSLFSLLIVAIVRKRIWRCFSSLFTSFGETNHERAVSKSRDVGHSGTLS